MFVPNQVHFWGLFSHPHLEWNCINHEKNNIGQLALIRLAILATIPTISFWMGLSHTGWSLSGVEFNKIPLSQSYLMAIGFYIAICVATLIMTYCTYWMEKVFGTKTSFKRCLLFITYTATPMYLAAIIGFIPIVWLTVLVLMGAVFYSLYLLYVGIPIYMNIDEGKGFIVATSIVGAGLCTLILFIVATILLWSIGF